MSIYCASMWGKCLDDTLELLPDLNRLNGSSVLVTGSNGLIGSAVLDLLIRHNETSERAVELYVAARSEEKATKRFGDYSKKPYFHFVLYDAINPIVFDIDLDYIIHCASNATPDTIMKEPVETMISNFSGLLNLFRYSKEHGVRRVVYISSGEIYGQKEKVQAFSETDYGYIDLLNPRNSYSVSKRAAETLCASFIREYGIESCIVRPCHIYGPTASPYDSRVSSAWAYSAARGENIVMKSDGSQLRSYCHCLDCASAILTVLLKGENGQAYNVSNKESIITIRQMAELICKVANVDLILENASENERKSYNPMNNSSLCSDRIEALGWKACFDPITGFDSTIRILKQIINSD